MVVSTPALPACAKPCRSRRPLRWRENSAGVRAPSGYPQLTHAARTRSRAARSAETLRACASAVPQPCLSIAARRRVCLSAASAAAGGLEPYLIRRRAAGRSPLRQARKKTRRSTRASPRSPRALKRGRGALCAARGPAQQGVASCEDGHARCGGRAAGGPARAKARRRSPLAVDDDDAFDRAAPSGRSAAQPGAGELHRRRGLVGCWACWCWC